MIKTANQQKVNTGASIKRRLSAAICMLLIATIMLVTSTYAWFTLSTAPEVKGINTSVAGNGSLEIALMPTTGLFSAISNGRGSSGTEYGGTKDMTIANTSWGNVVNLKDPYYGLDLVTLKPVVFDANDLSFARPAYGYDGRITTLKDAEIKSKGNSATFSEDGYGVRAIVDEGGTYGYVIDLALRLNTVASADENSTTLGKLLLQTDGAQRVYSDSTAASTQGGGSRLWFQDENGNDLAGADQARAAGYLNVIRVAFVQNFANADQLSSARVLAYARADVSTGYLTLCDYYGDPLPTDSESVILDAMNKNQAYQISVVVWLDGAAIENKDMEINNEVLSKATLNLQFSTDVTLVPAQDADLKDNPPASPDDVTPAASSSAVATSSSASAESSEAATTTTTSAAAESSEAATTTTVSAPAGDL